MRNRDQAALFGLSALALFLELALIRWVPAHVLYLTFFTNVVMLASFLGLSLGLLRSSTDRRLSLWAPLALAVLMLLAHAVEYARPWLERSLTVSAPGSPQLVFFGTDAFPPEARPFRLPVELLAGVFFALTALVFVPLGEELGRLFKTLGGGARSYAVNIAGSLAGVAVFALASRLELSPPWWFGVCALVFESFAGRAGRARRGACWFIVLCCAARTVGAFAVDMPAPDGSVQRLAGERLWSPYYRVDYLEPPVRDIRVNLIGHQRMMARSEPYVAYAVPHLLRRDSGGPPFKDVLVIGAGSGNDVSRALEWGAERVDAVEIDPALVRLGARDHPDRPYDDPRVAVRVEDGRRFLREPGRSYDLIVFALVDSLVLHSSYSSIRLESYLYTVEAFRDALRRLKPGGLLVLYNYYREGWIVGRLCEGLRRASGRAPLALSFPFRPTIGPDSRGGFTVLFAGDTDPLARAFARSAYFLRAGGAPSPSLPDGFHARPGEGWAKLALSEVEPGDVAAATDDWPFLYLRRPMIPDVSLRGTAAMALATAALLGAFWPRRRRPALDRGMFFLGAGFMLVEAKAVTGSALLFGGTWLVNCFVFAGILSAALGANLWVLRRRPKRSWPLYAGVFLSLAASAAVPVSRLLDAPLAARLLGAGLLCFAPALFAGAIFAERFDRSSRPAEDLAANTAGAMAGGLTEYLSMLWGFSGLNWVAMAFYALTLASGQSGPGRLE